MPTISTDDEQIVLSKEALHDLLAGNLGEAEINRLRAMLEPTECEYGVFAGDTMIPCHLPNRHHEFLVEEATKKPAAGSRGSTVITATIPSPDDNCRMCKFPRSHRIHSGKNHAVDQGLFVKRPSGTFRAS